MNITGKISTNKKKYGKYLPQTKFEGINFGRKKQDKKINQHINTYEEITGLNDLDSNILNKNPEKYLSKEPLRLEMQLEKAEKKVKKINEEIKLNKLLNIKNPQNNEQLEKTKKRLEKEIIIYRKQYRTLGLSYKIADTVNQANYTIEEKIIIIKDNLNQNTVIKKALNFIPGHKEKQKIKTAEFLHKKLLIEMNKLPQTEEIEHLLLYVLIELPC